MPQLLPFFRATANSEIQPVQKDVARPGSKLRGRSNPRPPTLIRVAAAQAHNFDSRLLFAGEIMAHGGRIFAIPALVGKSAAFCQLVDPYGLIGAERKSLEVILSRYNSCPRAKLHGHLVVAAAPSGSQLEAEALLKGAFPYNADAIDQSMLLLYSASQRNPVLYLARGKGIPPLFLRRTHAIHARKSPLILGAVQLVIRHRLHQLGLRIRHLH